jgi:hypothetical protein
VREGFGPWTPPARRPGAIDHETWTRIPEAGTFWVYSCIASASWVRYPDGASDDEAQTWCPGDPTSPGFEGFTCRDPYGSFEIPYVEVVVAPTPAP